MSVNIKPTNTSLRITEIFYSLQGETTRMGLPTIFIRLTRCPLRCSYCDSAYAFTGGTFKTIESILAEIACYKTQYVTVTGGEPLAQKGCWDLLKTLCDQGYDVSLETSGAISIVDIDKRVIKIMDLKTPGSGEVTKNYWPNIELLTEHDQVKFIICDKEDYEWSKNIIEQYELVNRCEILLSPSFHQVKNKELAEWILKDQIPVRMQIQLHKYIWGDVPGY